jgi:hypothetical protein
MTLRAFTDNYEDILELAHPVSPTRSRMSMIDRAAQFSPFAALTGHSEAVKETEAYVKECIEHEIEKLPIEDI